MYLVLEHLTKTFPTRGKEGDVTAVDDLSVAIEKGELVTLLGPAGCGKANFLQTQVVGVSPDRLDLNVFGRLLSMAPPESALPIGESVVLLARPEAIMLHRNGDGYPGRVCRAAYLGPIVEYDVEVTGVVLTLTQYDPREVYPLGTEVHVKLVEEALYLLPKG
ncbi:MAG: TOBE domain-containing protein [Nitrospinae bacterium]|nr:TOBE domain-containing protein [Nitrospinota bacterium]